MVETYVPKLSASNSSGLSRSESGEAAALCNCGSGESVVFQCEDENCQYFEKQKLFCPQCLVQTKHFHMPTIIAIKKQNVTSEWT